MFGRKVDLVGRKRINMGGNLYVLVDNASSLVENQLNLNPEAKSVFPEMFDGAFSINNGKRINIWIA